MACADIPMVIQGPEEEPEDQRDPVTKYFRPTKVMPAVKGPLHALLQKQPAALGSLQMVSGLFSVGVGTIFAFTQEMTKSLFTLFRVSYLTGSLLFIAGVLSNLLFKHPKMLPVCFYLNCGCITVAVVEAVCISVDLALWDEDSKHHLKIEQMELFVLAVDVFLCIILCICMWKERRTYSP